MGAGAEAGGFLFFFPFGGGEGDFAGFDAGGGDGCLEVEKNTTLRNLKEVWKIELGKKLNTNRFCLKISRMVGFDIQRFAGGQRPLGKKRSQEVTEATYVWQQASRCYSLKG